MLRKVKFLALVAMFFVALSASAQVTTSALSGIVTDENRQAMIGATITAPHTPSGIKYNAETNMDCSYPIRGMPPVFYDTASDKVHTGYGFFTVFSDPVWFLLLIIIVLVAIIIIVAVLKNKNIKIKYSDFDMEIGSKNNEKKRKT